jgi:hypothetical protein
MSTLALCLVIWLLLITGALTGVLLRRQLPQHHLDTHAKDVVRLGCALIATISGLMLSLLINSAKSNYDAQRDEVRQLATNIILLDHLLEQYGPESRLARGDLRAAVAAAVDRIWKVGTVKTERHTPFTATSPGQATERAIRALAPANEAQRLYQSQASQVLTSILQTRIVLYEQSGTHLPVAFLAVLVFWLFVLFVSFSLFSPLSPTALAAIVVIALSASGAVFLILDMSQPYSGLMQIDSAPIRQALTPLTTWNLCWWPASRSIEIRRMLIVMGLY